MIMLQGDNITHQKFLEIPPALGIAIRSLVHQEGKK